MTKTMVFEIYGIREKDVDEIFQDITDILEDCKERNIIDRYDYSETED